MADKFDFSEYYRDLDAGASREIVEARSKAFKKIQALFQKMTQIYDLCRVAYQVGPPLTSDWFEAPIKEFDPHFVLAKDSVDAARMAALVLRDHFARRLSYSPLAVLTASYCGRRNSADGNILVREANSAFHAAVRQHRVSDGSTTAAAPKLKAIAGELEAVNGANPLPGSLAKSAFDAAMSSTQGAINVLSDNVRTPLDTARSDIVRLAEEVDMLWWCMGDWHEMLGKARTETTAGLNMVVSGIELGAMVRQLPGPFGAYGILRKISGDKADANSSLKAALKSLSQDDAAKLSVDIPQASMPLFPVHTALQLVAQHGPVWEPEFVKSVPDVLNTKLTNNELGIQAFRERALIKYGNLS